jgi:DNA-binding IclR family transcriptional regulator
MNLNEKSLTAERTAKVILLFQENKKLSLTEITELLGISRTAAYRIVTTLKDMGLLIRDSSKKYMLAPIFLALAKMAEPDIRDIASPIMKNLLNEIPENICLSTSDDPNYFTFIECVEGPQPVKWTPKVGEPNFALGVGAVGKAHLAFKDEKEIEDFLLKFTPEKFTSNTITDKDKLMEEIRDIQKNGFAISEGERFEDLFGIAVPIFDRTERKAVAILSVNIPIFRFDKKMINQYVSLLKRAANEISAQIKGSEIKT